MGSKSKSSMRTKKRLPSPKRYQKRIAKRILRDDAVALHVGMGLGKTRSVLMALEKLVKKKGYRVLVVGPIPVVESTWPDEIEKWGFDLTYQLIRSKKVAERERQVWADADVYAINFEMLHWLANRKFRKFWKSIDVLVIDELTKTKSTKSAPFRILKGRRGWFKKRIGMTGTMLPESYVNLYGQFTVLTELWPDKLTFLEKYFKDESRDPRYSKHVLKNKKAKRKLRKKVKPHTLTLDSKDYLEVPDWTIQDYWFDLSPKARRYYDEFERDLYLQLGNDEDLVREFIMDPDDEDSTDAVADSVSSMRIKLRQCISGFMYNENKEPLIYDTTKLDFTARILDEIHEPTISMYSLVEERRQLIERFKGELLKGKDAIQRWNVGKTFRAVGHPASMGHGLNLQDGGRVMLFYSLPRSFEQYAQSIARIVRTGQSKNVIIARVLARNTIDEIIVEENRRKGEEQNAFTKALKTHNS